MSQTIRKFLPGGEINKTISVDGQHKDLGKFLKDLEYNAPKMAESQAELDNIQMIRDTISKRDKDNMIRFEGGALVDPLGEIQLDPKNKKKNKALQGAVRILSQGLSSGYDYTEPEKEEYAPNLMKRVQDSKFGGKKFNKDVWSLYDYDETNKKVTGTKNRELMVADILDELVREGNEDLEFNTKYKVNPAFKNKEAQLGAISNLSSKLRDGQFSSSDILAASEAGLLGDLQTLFSDSEWFKSFKGPSADEIEAKQVEDAKQKQKDNEPIIDESYKNYGIYKVTNPQTQESILLNNQNQPIIKAQILDRNFTNPDTLAQSGSFVTATGNILDINNFANWADEEKAGYHQLRQKNLGTKLNENDPIYGEIAKEGYTHVNDITDYFSELKDSGLSLVEANSADPNQKGYWLFNDAEETKQKVSKLSFNDVTGQWMAIDDKGNFIRTLGSQTSNGKTKERSVSINLKEFNDPENLQNIVSRFGSEIIDSGYDSTNKAIKKSGLHSQDWQYREYLRNLMKQYESGKITNKKVRSAIQLDPESGQYYIGLGKDRIYFRPNGDGYSLDATKTKKPTSKTNVPGTFGMASMASMDSGGKLEKANKLLALRTGGVIKLYQGDIMKRGPYYKPVKDKNAFNTFEVDPTFAQQSWGGYVTGGGAVADTKKWIETYKNANANATPQQIADAYNAEVDKVSASYQAMQDEAFDSKSGKQKIKASSTIKNHNVSQNALYSGFNTGENGINFVENKAQYYGPNSYSRTTLGKGFESLGYDEEALKTNENLKLDGYTYNMKGHISPEDIVSNIPLAPTPTKTVSPATPKTPPDATQVAKTVGTSGTISTKTDPSGKITVVPGGSSDPKLPKRGILSAKDILGAGDLIHTLYSNRKIADKAKEGITPLITDVAEPHLKVRGNLVARQAGEQAAGELHRQTARPFTSDASLQLAGQLDASRIGRGKVMEGIMMDNQEIIRTGELARDQENRNLMARQQNANENTSRFLQTKQAKNQIDTARMGADATSVQTYMKELGMKAAEKEDMAKKIHKQESDNYYQGLLSAEQKKWQGSLDSARKDWLAKNPTKGEADWQGSAEYLKASNNLSLAQENFMNKVRTSRLEELGQLYGVKVSPRKTEQNWILFNKQGSNLTRLQAAKLNNDTKIKIHNSKMFHDNIQKSTERTHKTNSQLSAFTMKLIHDAISI